MSTERPRVPVLGSHDPGQSVSGAARIVSLFIGFNGLILTGVIVAMIVKALELAFQEEGRRLEAFKRSENEESEYAAE